MTNNQTIDGVSREPTPAMTEAGCQSYMDADGMIGIMHNSSMGHAYVAMRALDPEAAALQSTIAQLQARIAVLESGRGEAAGHVFTMEALVPGGDVRCHAVLYQSLPNGAKLYAAPPAPVTVVLPERQDRSTIPYDSANDYADGWNDCLNATATLNTPKTAEWHDAAGDDEGLVS